MKVFIVSDYLPGLIDAWKKHGYDVVLSNRNMKNCSYSDAFETIDVMMRTEKIQLVFSYNFEPQISDACEKHKLEYISWLMDSSNTQFLTKSVYNSVNRMITFDYVQYNKLKMLGVHSVYHLPIHVSSYIYTSIIKKHHIEPKSYLNDVTLVEDLCDVFSYDQMRNLPEFLKGYIDATINAQRCIWGGNIVNKLLNDTIISEIKDYVSLQIPENAIEGYYENCFREIVHERIARLEKDELCESLLSKYDFVEYKRNNGSHGLCIGGKNVVDYNKIPIIFADSKININITPHSVDSGIPLRVMEVLACGGFCLTNYQAEITEYFEDGKDLVVYTDFDDMYDKIDYYLEHEFERMEIAFSGQKKLRKLFELDDGIGKILQMIYEG